VPPPYPVCNIRLLTISSVHCIHLLNLRDGSPYRAPPSNVIAWTIPQGLVPIKCGELAITASRIMLYLSHDVVLRNGKLHTMVVWDRKTGDLVRILWPQSGHIPDFIAGIPPFHCGMAPRFPYFFPRRVSNGGSSQLHGYRSLRVGRVRHAHPTGPSEKLAKIRPPATISKCTCSHTRR